MTDGPGNETTSEDVDYFVSWIADHCCAETSSKKNEAQETNNSSKAIAVDEAPSSSTTAAACPSPAQSMPVHPRRLSNSTIDAKGLDQIVKCFGCHRDESELWLSLEYCGGGSVADLIRLSDGPLSEGEIGWIMSQILLGLAYLHDGDVKLGGSGSIMDHKEGAGEKKRRRRSLTMSEFPASWLAPESTPTTPSSPSSPYSSFPRSFDSPSHPHQQQHTMPEASTETDIWALGVACIELSQGRAPRPETPIFVSFGEQRMTSTLSLSPSRSANNVAAAASACSGTGGGETWNYSGSGPYGGMMMMMGLSEELWMFIGRCLTPEPEARPTVRELLQDPFIVMHSELSQELLGRIHQMMDFVDQCAVISSDGLLQDTSLTLSPSKATQLFDQQLEEERVGPWLIPMVRPRVDSVYDGSSFFDEAGLPIAPSDQKSDPDTKRLLTDWKHQRVSHPVVKQALLRDRAGYITFRHSRSPSLATIPENQLLEEHIYATTMTPGQVSCSTDPRTNERGRNEEEEEEEEFEDHVLVELVLDSEVANVLVNQSNHHGHSRTKTVGFVHSEFDSTSPRWLALDKVDMPDNNGVRDMQESASARIVVDDSSVTELDMDDSPVTLSSSSLQRHNTTSTSADRSATVPPPSSQLSSTSFGVPTRRLHPTHHFLTPSGSLTSVMASIMPSSSSSSSSSSSASSSASTPSPTNQMRAAPSPSPSPSPSSTPVFIRPRTISTTSTATTSSASTITPNKSLERMLMMMRRTDKTMASSELHQHSEYLGYYTEDDEDDDDGEEGDDDEELEVDIGENDDDSGRVNGKMIGGRDAGHHERLQSMEDMESENDERRWPSCCSKSNGQDVGEGEVIAEEEGWDGKAEEEEEEEEGEEEEEKEKEDYVQDQDQDGDEDDGASIIQQPRRKHRRYLRVLQPFQHQQQQAKFGQWQHNASVDEIMIGGGGRVQHQQRLQLQQGRRHSLQHELRGMLLMNRARPAAAGRGGGGGGGEGGRRASESFASSLLREDLFEGGGGEDEGVREGEDEDEEKKTKMKKKRQSWLFKKRPSISEGLTNVGGVDGGGSNNSSIIGYGGYGGGG
ncbi:hypothetical protein BG004_000881, partial [Podila humilis]